MSSSMEAGAFANKQIESGPIYRATVPSLTVVLLAMASGGALVYVLASLGLLHVFAADLQAWTVLQVIVGLGLCIAGWRRVLKRQTLRR